MKREIQLYLTFLLIVFLALAISGYLIRSTTLFIVFSLANLILCLMNLHPATRWAKSTSQPPAARRIRGYSPRPTDAGHWVDAPIAEVDKSTFGKLLASRMRREPGLNVIVRGRGAETPPVGSDAPLYDAELDGQP